MSCLAESEAEGRVGCGRMGQGGFGRGVARLGRSSRLNWSTPEMKTWQRSAKLERPSKAINHDPATGHEDGSVVGYGDSIETQVAGQESKIGERFGPLLMSLLLVS